MTGFEAHLRGLADRLEDPEDVSLIEDVIAEQARLEVFEVFMVDYDEACKSQGLPPNTPVERFIRHYTGNAAVTAALNTATRGFVMGAHDGMGTKCLGCEYVRDALIFDLSLDLTQGEIETIVKSTHRLATDAKIEYDNREDGAP